MTQERNLVQHEKESIDIDCLTLKKLYERITVWLNNYGSEATIEKMQYQYEDGHYLAICVMEPETDAEYEERMNKEAHFARYREAQDKVDYARLRAKFEPI